MQISVFSEVSRLEHVLIHRWAELEQPLQGLNICSLTIYRLLQAPKEHDAFAQALKSVTVHYLVT